MVVILVGFHIFKVIHFNNFGLVCKEIMVELIWSKIPSSINMTMDRYVSRALKTIILLIIL